MDAPAPEFPGFRPDVLAALDVPGVNERWAAVQEQLHPALLALAEQLRAEGMRRFPRAWPLYELSFRSLRFVNRGPNQRAPIDSYHVAFDRPPRGCGLLVAVSGAERQIVVALQISVRQRKDDMRRVWEAGRALWLPLVQQVSEVRFAEGRARGREAQTDGSETWMDRYLGTRGSAYLLAGFAYSWDDARVAQPEFARQIIDDALALFPLNEALMEQAEELDPFSAAMLRERRAPYVPPALPPIETIVERIHARGFAIADSLIRAYHVALQTKPLVILPGISGTGKTRLTRLYADAVLPAPSPGNDHYLLVAVQPDWHNARDLLGYYNALTNKFHPTPFLRFLLRAAADPA
ncbi:GTPase, partial [Kouleothrix aurantiaca]